MAYKVEHNKPECIGCGSCAAIAEKFWEMDEKSGKAHLKGSKLLPGGQETKDIEDSDFELIKETADICPVNVIHIKDKKGNKLI